MEPILPGGRGPAVEDVQRRLLSLGYDLGPTGIDGVFLGKTRDAVRAFQSRHGLSEDGVVGDETWAALVDETFTLGDRMLYLRMPYFHGRDVRDLQTALNTLGFSCGAADGIFGPFSERAVREFQRNCGIDDDGIVGPDTVRALEGLRHVWEGKDSRMPPSATVATSRAADLLARHPLRVLARGVAAEEVARRFENLALAANEGAIIVPSDERGREITLSLRLVESSSDAPPSAPVVVFGETSAEGLAGRLITAMTRVSPECPDVYVDLGVQEGDEVEYQRRAVRLLDAVCSALASIGTPW